VEEREKIQNKIKSVRKGRSASLAMDSQGGWNFQSSTVT